MNGEHDRERAARQHDESAEQHERNAERLDRHGATRDAARERRDAQTRRDAAERERRRAPDEAGPSSTTVTRRFDAPRDRVYEALLDPEAVARWRFPRGMTCEVHRFEPREGGTVRISLTYDAPDRTGKTTGRTDSYHGRFVRLVPNELVVEVDEFETSDPALRGEMTITVTLRDDDGGTELVAVHEGLPAGIAPADNELGWQEALTRLAALVEP
jgi:uncharacterized protein YndB with AHSA1/START domain